VVPFAQGAHARSVLDALPGRAAILERIRAIGAAAAPEVSLPVDAGGRWFYTIRRPGEPVPRLYVRDAWTGEERLIVDPASTGGSGAPGPHRLATFRPPAACIVSVVTSGDAAHAVTRDRSWRTVRHQRNMR
jgi:hypothetical protein